MKKLYELPWSRYARPWLAVLLLLLSSSVSSFAQTFTETFGTAGPKTIAQANAAKDFDNSSAFQYSGNSSLIQSSQYIPVSPISGRSFIFFGDSDPATGDIDVNFPANVRTLSIKGINTTQLSNVALRFQLYVNPGANATLGAFVVEYRTSQAFNAAYTTISEVDLSGGEGWRNISIANPFKEVTGNSVEIRFRRANDANEYIAIDDVVLSGTVAPNFTVTPTSLMFPNTAVNQTSTEQIVTVKGSGLTSGIAVQAPTGYRIRKQGDAAYLAEGSTLTLSQTNGVVNTVVEIVFNPTTAGTYNGQISFVSGTVSQFVKVSGQAVTPAIIVTPRSLAFGNVEVNTTSATQSISVQGSNLTAGISVQVPTGYKFRKQGDATYLAAGNTLTLTQSGGTVSAVVEVQFAPTTKGDFNGNVSFVSSGATTQFVALTGTGVAAAPVVTVTPSAITFANTQISRTSEPTSFFVSGQNLDNNTIIVTSPSDEFQIRRGTTGSFGSRVDLTGTNGTLASTELQVQFTPSATGNRAATIAAASGTTVNSILQVNGNGLPAPTTPNIFISPDPATLDFGTISSSGSGAPDVLTFKVGGTLLGNNPLVLTPANSTSSNPDIQIREANVGSFQSGPLTFQPVNGNVTERTIEVRLRGAIPKGSFTGTITAASPKSGASDKVVNVIANSNGTAATLSIDVSALKEFSTVPGVASAVQTFFVNGTGLIQDITLKAPVNFQIALSQADFASLNGATGNTISAVRSNAAGDGFDNPVPIYVRYLPTVANPQPDLASISVTSEPATGASVQVTGLSAPAIEILSPAPPINNIVINTLSAPAAVTIRAVRVRQSITVSEVLTNTSEFNFPIQDQFQISLTQNDADFDKTVTFSPNPTTFSVDQVVYVRYVPTHIGAAKSKLQYRSNDFETKAFQDFPTLANAELNGKALDTQPTTQTVITVTRNESTATVFFSPGQGTDANGAGEGRLIIASLSNELSGSSQPVDGQTYLANNNTFGEGKTIAPGYYSVYTGTGDQAVIKGLDPARQYYFYVFDYNYVTTNNIGQRKFVPGAENYRTPTPPNQVVPVAAVSPGNPIVLPVELTAFTATLRNAKVNLIWSTASEKNSKGFEVQRSQNGKDFAPLQFVAGQGSTSSTTNYAAVDAQPLGGTSYYRLKQVDHDGTFAYSPVAVITNGAAPASEVSLYPNPAQDVVTVSLGQLSAAGARVTVADMMGRVVLSEQLGVNGELNVARLQAGTYIVTVETGGQKISRKLAKTN